VLLNIWRDLQQQADDRDEYTHMRINLNERFKSLLTLAVTRNKREASTKAATLMSAMVSVTSRAS